MWPWAMIVNGAASVSKTRRSPHRPLVGNQTRNQQLSIGNDQDAHSRRSRRSKTPHVALLQTIGYAPVIARLMILGFFLLLMLILGVVPWGTGRGCWAQC